jgi:hypothetical protein
MHVAYCPCITLNIALVPQCIATALLEIPTLIALFFRDFDAELIGPLPEPGWSGDNGDFWVAPRCAPKGWPHGVDGCKVQYKRRPKQANL